jgi:Family of unknown function (DUF6069)
MKETTMTTALDASTVTTPRRRPVWVVCATAALAAAVTTELYGLLARACGIRMSIRGIGTGTTGPLFVGSFAMAVFIFCFWATILAVLLARFARRPARAWLFVTVPVTALSLLLPALASDATVATKLMLGLAHLIVAAIVIPTVARRLAAVPR